MDYCDTRPYICATHGRFRSYMDFLFEFKNWCIVMVTVCIVPLGLVVFESGIDLNWIFYVGAILTIPCFPPVLLSIVWVKATSQGLIAGLWYIKSVLLFVWSRPHHKSYCSFVTFLTSTSLVFGSRSRHNILFRTCTTFSHLYQSHVKRFQFSVGPYQSRPLIADL